MMLREFRLSPCVNSVFLFGFILSQALPSRQPQVYLLPDEQAQERERASLNQYF